MFMRTCLLLALVAVAFSAHIREEDNHIKIGLNKRLRYGKHTLQTVKNHVQGLKKKQGSVTLKDAQDMYYYGPMNIGTPGQKFLVDYDTGSSDLWIASKKYCTDNPSYCKTHDSYDSSKSKSYKKNGQSFYIQYGSGDVAGFLSQDKAKVAGLPVKNQIFGEATDIDEQTQTMNSDGILGLAYKSLSEFDANPVFVNMISQKAVKQPVFAFYLDQEEPAGNGGAELTLGGVDKKHYTGDFTWTDVTEQQYWKINIDGIKLKSKILSKTHAAIPDSGTSLIYGPEADFDKINKAIGGQYSQGIYYVDCSKVKSFPDISFTIGGKDFVLHGTDYVVKLEDEETNSETCVSGLVGDDSMPFMILGDVFMRKYYTQFDMGKNRIGFAPSK